MGFTTPCFIRKNTPELRKKLEELGYVKNSPIWTDNCSIIWAYQYPVKGFDTPNYVIANSFDIPFDKHSLLCGEFIDCGTNEELFLAIATLRDDTDDSQWFVYPPENIWFICDDDDINYARENIKDSVQAAWFHCSHKATVEELIEHFKEKEE
ncbi:MAG: hypothetical protein [Bacteriophage sp.]|nr:MAG: hypothetical protein [Bacteriophage sp.]